MIILGLVFSPGSGYSCSGIGSDLGTSGHTGTSARTDLGAGAPGARGGALTAEAHDPWHGPPPGDEGFGRPLVRGVAAARAPATSAAVPLLRGQGAVTARRRARRSDDHAVRHELAPRGLDGEQVLPEELHVAHDVVYLPLLRRVVALLGDLHLLDLLQDPVDLAIHEVLELVPQLVHLLAPLELLLLQLPPRLGELHLPLLVVRQDVLLELLELPGYVLQEAVRFIEKLDVTGSRGGHSCRDRRGSQATVATVHAMPAAALERGLEP
eukprot:CAMPEP_0179229422 /NCGR_PEP_ID=MMETSP0797-20121207/10324_1 /TAXON_ID=47934 /ORGANISM="Dinophysis acuminata, Strain DAEP01" /LENGTH=267 /DNA_ID=CAMNT_0020936487 /DNA_START=94 /DNA_END=896 /DNA_ORIENTATION=-